MPPLAVVVATGLVQKREADTEERKRAVERRCVASISGRERGEGRGRRVEKRGVVERVWVELLAAVEIRKRDGQGRAAMAEERLHGPMDCGSLVFGLRKEMHCCASCDGTSGAQHTSTGSRSASLRNANTGPECVFCASLPTQHLIIQNGIYRSPAKRVPELLLERRLNVLLTEGVDVRLRRPIVRYPLGLVLRSWREEFDGGGDESLYVGRWVG